ncbi:MAG: sensor histidine kinase [Deltaproteobacteria bacterium]|nr:sensor histidine kinase [Deltaproteobacteria bacterium]
MLSRVDRVGWRALVSARAWMLLWIPIALVSAAHYTTGTSFHWLHDIFRRLYYIPIILGAFVFGRPGALGASIAASIAYAPHAFTTFFVQDPAHGTEKVLEILLYNVVAFITGTLADREHRERVRQEETAHRLRESLEDVRLMERQLIRAGRLQSLGEMTAGLAHEIKNPLASLKGAVEIISDEISEMSPRRKMVEILRKEIDRLNDLLERFLSFARPSGLHRADVPLAEVAAHAIALVESTSRVGGVTVALAPGEDSVVVSGDRDKIAQVVFNLLINAVQATVSGGTVRVRCERATRARRSFGVLVVEDTGPGLAEEIREKIFDPFFTTKEDGTGLGLSIAARIADEHQGFIEADNRPEGGAVFRLLLPLS